MAKKCYDFLFNIKIKKQYWDESSSSARDRWLDWLTWKDFVEGKEFICAGTNYNRDGIHGYVRLCSESFHGKKDAVIYAFDAVEKTVDSNFSKQVREQIEKIKIV